MKNFLLIITALAVFNPLATAALESNACSAHVPVTLSLESEITKTVPGASIGIYAVAHNQSSELISDAAISIDVVNKDSGAIVDRFVAPDRFAIFADASARIGFIWQIPDGLGTGTYEVRATFAPKKATRAEIASGVIYPRATLDIAVRDGNRSSVDIASIAVNAQHVESRSVTRLVPGQNEAVATVQNDLDSPHTGTFLWQVYAPNATLVDAPASSGSVPFELHPGKSANLSYNIEGGLDAYYVEGILADPHAPRYIDLFFERTPHAFAWSICVPQSKSGSVPLDMRFFAGAIILITIAAVAYASIRYRRPST